MAYYRCLSLRFSVQSVSRIVDESTTHSPRNFVLECSEFCSVCPRMANVICEIRSRYGSTYTVIINKKLYESRWYTVLLNIIIITNARLTTVRRGGKGHDCAEKNALKSRRYAGGHTKKPSRRGAVRTHAFQVFPSASQSHGGSRIISVGIFSHFLETDKQTSRVNVSNARQNSG